MQTSIQVLTLTVAGSVAGLGCGGRIAVGGEETADGGDRPIAVLDASLGPTGDSSTGPALIDSAASAAGLDSTLGTTDSQVESGEESAPSTTRTLSVTTDMVSLPGNNELIECQVFANPFLEDVDLVSMGASGSAGIHDVSVYALSPSTGQTTPTAAGPCTYDPSGTQPVLYRGAASQFATLTYPQANMGYRLSAHKSLLVRTLYLNVSSDAANVQVTISLGVAKPGVVTTYVGNLLLVNRTLLSSSVPPSLISTASWTPPAGMFSSSYFIYGSLYYVSGISISVNAGDKTIFDIAGNQFLGSSSVVMMSPVSMTPGQGLSWSCSFDTSRSPPTYCTYQGLYYPADPENADLIEPP